MDSVMATLAREDWLRGAVGRGILGAIFQGRCGNGNMSGSSIVHSDVSGAAFSLTNLIGEEIPFSDIYKFKFKSRTMTVQR